VLGQIATVNTRQLLAGGGGRIKTEVTFCGFGSRSTWHGKNVLTHRRLRCIFWVGFRMQTYTIYTQCDHCGIYDRNPQWCALCQRPKEAKRRENVKAPVTDPLKADAASAGGLAPRTRQNSV
jgi:hypothetical protein